MNLYKVLEIEPLASISEIKAAYKRLVLKHHPDKTGGETTQTFLDVQNAYEILTDDFKRGIYDRYDDNNVDFNIPKNSDEWKQLINKVGMHMVGFMQENLFPKDIEISLKVCMGDIYNRKFKRINVKVKRWDEDEEFVTSSEMIYIDCSQCIEPITVFTFDNMGDASIFRAISRSNIVVTVDHIVDENIHISHDFGMSVSFDMCLEEFTTKENFIITSSGLNIEVPNMKKTSYVVPNKGLYANNKLRGDLLVLINIK
jgi:DnaJ-class molecular chaperone